MAPDVSPLDETLGLSGSSPYSKRVLAWLVRLGAEMPFARAACWLEELTGVVVSAATVRRQTEAVGTTAVAQADAEGEALTHDLPLPPARAERRVLGADGAMVPLPGGEWAEVKLVSIGDPVEQGAEIRTTQVSYWARLADAATFERVALGELQRRGCSMRRRWPRCKMGRGGCKALWTITVPMRCASSTGPMRWST